MGDLTDFVEGLQVTDGRGRGQVVWEFILQVSDQHPKLGPPVSHMVQPENGTSTQRVKTKYQRRVLLSDAHTY